MKMEVLCLNQLLWKEIKSRIIITDKDCNGQMSIISPKKVLYHLKF